MRITTLATLATLIAMPAFAASDYTVLKIGDNEVKKSEVMEVWNGLFPPGQAPDFEGFDEKLKQNVLRGIVSEHMLYEEAKEQKIPESKEIQKQVEIIERKLSVKKLLDDKSALLISESDVKKDYDRMVRDMRDEKEVRARHILVADESKAKELKQKITDGADFETLAKENSTDKGSAKQGGDLGFFVEGQMVPAFSKTAFALKDGEVSEPVKTDFGWHIIKREESRKVTIPTYNDVKEQLRMQLQEVKLNDFVEGLVKDVDVKYFGKDGKEKPFAVMPEAAAKAE